MHARLETLGDFEYTEAEQESAMAIQRATGKPEVGMDATIEPRRETGKTPRGGSAGAGEVSYVVSTIRPGAPIAGKDVRWPARSSAVANTVCAL